MPSVSYRAEQFTYDMTAIRCPLNPQTHRNIGLPFITKPFRCTQFTGSNAFIKTTNIPLTIVLILPTGEFDHQVARHPNRSTFVKNTLRHWTVFGHLYARHPVLIYEEQKGSTDSPSQLYVPGMSGK